MLSIVNKQKNQYVLYFLSLTKSFLYVLFVLQATGVIKKLQVKNKKLVNQKSALLLEKRAKATNVFTLISSLPPEQKYVESKKLMAVINSIEPIEIVDSDEEKGEKSPSAKVRNKYAILAKFIE